MGHSTGVDMRVYILPAINFLITKNNYLAYATLKLSIRH